MKKLCLIIILLIIVKISTGQSIFECGTLDDTSLKSATCNDWNNYAAVDPINTPIKTVRLTFHIMQKAIFTGNFPDNSASRDWLRLTLRGALDGRMGGLQAMSLPTSSPTVPDSRVRFEIANIYFWNDDYGWEFKQISMIPHMDMGRDYLFPKYVLNEPSVSNKDNSVHIFICGTDNSEGYASDFGDKSFIVISGTYKKYLNNDIYGAASLLAHELGHSMGLHHAWYSSTSKNNDFCNDTPENPNCWNVNETWSRDPKPNTGQCVIPSNNLMDYNANEDALTITQVNRMHYFLLGGEGNISDCVINGVAVANPTIIGPDLICSSGATYIPSNLQLGVTSQWNTSPSNILQTNSDCVNFANVFPNSSSTGGEGQINWTFGWGKYGTSTVSKNVWVGKVDQLNLCAFDRNIYQADNIFSPGASCQPMSAIIDNGKSVTLIGGEVTLNGGFEVTNGAELQVIVANGCELEIDAPTLVATSTVSFLTCNSATSGGNVISDGGAAIIERGLCWGTSANPTIANSKVTSGTGTGFFSATLSSLVPGTTYHVRSYATNSAGKTGYGTETSYTRLTSKPLLLPTTAASFITTTTATAGGNVIFDGCNTVTERGICWSTSENPTTSDSKSTSGVGGGIFSVGMTGLSATTKYYVRAYAKYGSLTEYGTQISFTTTTTDELLSALTSRAISGGPTYTAIEYKVTLTHYAMGDTYFLVKHTNSTNTGYTSEVILVKNGEFSGTTIYTYYRNNSSYNALCDFNGIPTGWIKTTSLLSNSITASAALILAPTELITITATTAKAKSNMTYDASTTVTERGFCWSITPDPTIPTNNKVNYYIIGQGDFSFDLKPLSPCTTYYARAYAISTVGTVYGSQISFTTPPAATLAATTSATGITCNSAVSGGNVTSDNGSAVTEKGICWATTSNPTTANSKVTNGTGTGSYSCSLIGLTPGITYFVRSYAINNNCIGYGDQISFTTLALSAPTVNTLTASLYYSALSVRGDATADGGGAITAKGVYYKTSAGSESGGSTVAGGTGTGVFSGTTPTVLGNQIYYYRAFATNSAGTALGSELNITTPAAPSVSATTAATSITNTTASSGGNTTACPGTMSAQGICYNTTGTPTTANTKVSSASLTTGTYTCNMTGLTPNTLYYVRAYCSNYYNTSYGAQISFTTLAPPTVATTSTYTGLGSTTVYNSGNVTSDGGSAITARGICYMSGSGTPTTANSTKTATGTTGTYNCTLTGLTASTLYSFRAYATNLYGTSYGTVYTFTTQPATKTITASTTWTAPTGVTSCYIYCWGGGGAGGPATGIGGKGGGGAGGAYATYLVSCTPGTGYTATVGAGGVASTSAVVNGGTTSFNTIVAAGGAGGAIATTGSSAGGVGTTSGSSGYVVYAGGSGGGGYMTTSGGGGGGAGSTGAGNAGSLGGAGGAAKANNGGAGGAGTATQGVTAGGSSYGGGGAGACSTTVAGQRGGNGASGLIILTFP